MGILKKFKRKKRREREAKERLFYPQMEEPENTIADIVKNDEQSEIADVQTIDTEISTEEKLSESSGDNNNQPIVEESQITENQDNQPIVEEINEENQKIQINEQNNEINIEDNVQVSDAIDMEKKKS